MSHDACSLQGLKQGDRKKRGEIPRLRKPTPSREAKEKEKASAYFARNDRWGALVKVAAKSRDLQTTRHRATAHRVATYKPIRELGSKGHRGYGGIRSRTAVSCDLR